MNDLEIIVKSQDDGLYIEPPSIVFECFLGNPAQITRECFRIEILVDSLDEQLREMRLKAAATDLLVKMYRRNIVEMMLNALVTSALKGENPLK